MFLMHCFMTSESNNNGHFGPNSNSMAHYLLRHSATFQDIEQHTIFAHFKILSYFLTSIRLSYLSKALQSQLDLVREREDVITLNTIGMCKHIEIERGLNETYGFKDLFKPLMGKPKFWSFSVYFCQNSLGKSENHRKSSQEQGIRAKDA